MLKNKLENLTPKCIPAAESDEMAENDGKDLRSFMEGVGVYFAVPII